MAPGSPCPRGIFGGQAYRPVSVGACRGQAWTLKQANRQTGEVRLVPFRCNSWRCTRCAPRVNARDAARIEGALETVPLEELVFVTLTFDPKRWPSAATAWRCSKDCWKRLTDNLRYRYGYGIGRDRVNARIVYVQTWEQHASGWPHVHAIVHCRELAQDIRKQGQFYSKAQLRHVWRWQKSVLQPEAQRAGFGWSCDVDFPRKDRGALGGYLLKLAKELTGSDAKHGQTPVAAPKGFRRLRATERFLAPIRDVQEVCTDHNGELVSLWTGALVLAPSDWIEAALEAAEKYGEEALGDGLRRALAEFERSPWPGLSSA